MSQFIKLLSLNVNDKTEKKKAGTSMLTYLSWSYAWAEFVKQYPEATFTVREWNGLPYQGDPEVGYMVQVSVCNGEGLTHTGFLPVMDNNNNAVKAKSYEYTTKWGTKTVDAMDMVTVNKAIQRCMVKTLAYFGLGLYIYAGSDLPEESAEIKEEKATAEKTHRGAYMDKLKPIIELYEIKKEAIFEYQEGKYTSYADSVISGARELSDVDLDKFKDWLFKI
jgi:hypothetical protein